MNDYKVAVVALPVLAVILFLGGTGCTKSEKAGENQPAARSAPPTTAAGAKAPAPAEVEDELAVWADADPDLGKAPLAVQLSADPLEEIDKPSYTWDFGDGSAPSSEQNPTHVYARTGQYTARLTVKDASGRVGTDETQIDVE